jgi:hypothetical protein
MPSQKAIYDGLIAVGQLNLGNFRMPQSKTEWTELIEQWQGQLHGMSDDVFTLALNQHIQTSTWAPSPGHIRVAWDQLNTAATYDARFASGKSHGMTPEEAEKHKLPQSKVAEHRRRMKIETEAGAKILKEGRAERLAKYGPKELRRKEPT